MSKPRIATAVLISVKLLSRRTRYLGLFAGILFLTTVLSAQQEPSLGDVARSSRASHSAKAKKVITDDEIAPQTLTGDEDPNEVVKNAALALVKNRDFRCREEAAGNSGPGWIDNRTLEVFGDRIRFTFEQPKDNPARREVILTSTDGFSRMDNEPWQKINPLEFGIRPGQAALEPFLPDPLKFGYSPGDLKQSGRDTSQGVPTLLYTWSTHTSALDRTVKIWIGIDGLPRRTEMQTYDREIGTKWNQDYWCVYGVHPTIELPM